MTGRAIFIGVLLILLAALLGGVIGMSLTAGRGGPLGTAGGAAPDPAPTIRPQDFALLPCPVETRRAFCAIVAAGGKRLLIGAPAGIGPGQLAGETQDPDAVILPVLSADWLEGLDEIRHRTWLNGRRRALTVSGPDGLASIVDGLNAAYTVPDAIAYVAADSQIEFDAALLAAVETAPGGTLFDTGDLTVTARAGAPQTLQLVISYGGRSILLIPCGTERLTNVPNMENIDDAVICETVTRDASIPVSTWPVTFPLFFNGP
ncbi:MAG: hypothetical protein AAGJ29_05595 [Pseudomonadota bacterium]